jgi:hypothetical protein
MLFAIVFMGALSAIATLCAWVAFWINAAEDWGWSDPLCFICGIGVPLALILAIIVAAGS